MPSKSQKNSNVTSILKEDFKLKNKSSSKLISLNRTAKRAGLTKKALACAMSILTLCPSVSVSANKTSKETEIPTTSIDKKEISSSKSQTISETVKEYIKNNPGKSAAEITFIAILVIGGYLILNRNRQTTPPKVKKAAATKGWEEKRPNNTRYRVFHQ